MKQQYPKMVYRMKDGELDRRIIDGPPIPEGWSDDLEGVKAGKVTPKKTAKKKKKKAR